MSKKQHPTISPYDRPVWLSEDCKLLEVPFCEEFLKENPMLCIGGTFFTTEGRVTDEEGLKKQIYDKIKPYFSSGVHRMAGNLLDALRVECYSPPLPVQHDRIHAANGTYFLDGHFEDTKDFCINRLPVAYRPEATAPKIWLEFLDQLLIPEDILTLQEFMGYCLIHSTKAQKMLLMVGKGGEGKSRIGLVLRSILGSNMNTGSIDKVENNKFAAADLEHELVMLDDDLKMEALTQTNHIKAIVTAELPMDLEKKGQQSYQGRLYARFIGFGNGTLQALHDRSVGFFRRQIILTVKDKPADRVDDPFLAEKMCAEAEGIFLWMLEGLGRLRANNYRFTLSDRAKEKMTEAVRDGNNIIEFLASDGYICFKADSEVSSKDLYAVYRLWCEDNTANALSAKSFGAFLKQNEAAYNLEYTNKIHIGGGKYARGFLGIKLLQRIFP